MNLVLEEANERLKVPLRSLLSWITRPKVRTAPIVAMELGQMVGMKLRESTLVAMHVFTFTHTMPSAQLGLPWAICMSRVREQPWLLESAWLDLLANQHLHVRLL